MAREQHKEKKHKIGLARLSNQSGISNYSQLEDGYGLSLTMPNPTKQFENPGWAAGYADGYIDGLEEAWARINAEIERRPMPQRERDQSCNGLLLACKLIAPPRK